MKHFHKAFLVLAALALTACVKTGMTEGEAFPSGTQMSSSYVGSPATIDGVNGTIFEMKIAKINKYGDPITSVDPVTGEDRVEFARVDYQFVSDEPIGGEILKITWSSITDVGVAAATLGLSKMINGGCGSRCSGGGMAVVNLTNTVESVAGATANNAACPTCARLE